MWDAGKYLAKQICYLIFFFYQIIFGTRHEYHQIYFALVNQEEISL